MTTYINPHTIMIDLGDEQDDAMQQEAEAALHAALDPARLDQFLRDHAADVFWGERYDQCPVYAFLDRQWHGTPFGVRSVCADEITITVRGREVDCSVVPAFCPPFVHGVDTRAWELAGRPSAEMLAGEERPGYPITCAEAHAVLHAVLPTLPQSPRDTTP